MVARAVLCSLVLPTARQAVVLCRLAAARPAVAQVRSRSRLVRLRLQVLVVCLFLLAAARLALAVAPCCRLALPRAARAVVSPSLRALAALAAHCVWLVAMAAEMQVAVF